MYHSRFDRYGMGLRLGGWPSFPLGRRLVCTCTYLRCGHSKTFVHSKKKKKKRPDDEGPNANANASEPVS